MKRAFVRLRVSRSAEHSTEIPSDGSSLEACFAFKRVYLVAQAKGESELLCMPPCESDALDLVDGGDEKGRHEASGVQLTASDRSAFPA